MDRDPGLARRVVQTWSARRGIHAEANPLTGRILVDYDQRLIHLEDLVAEVAHLQLPPLPGEDDPVHPLDSAPLVRARLAALRRCWGSGSSLCSAWFRLLPRAMPRLPRQPRSSMCSRPFRQYALACAGRSEKGRGCAVAQREHRRAGRR